MNFWGGSVEIRQVWVELHPGYCRERLSELMEIPKGKWLPMAVGPLKDGDAGPMVKKEIDLISGCVRTTFENGSTLIESFTRTLGGQ